MRSQLTPSENIRQGVWRVIYPVFPRLQKHLLRWHLISHEEGRQPYHLGYLAPRKTLRELEEHLHEMWGFGNHFVAWTDEGQVLSWRKLVSFEHQFHLRVFSDGEIRGHYEYTPEAKPLAHFTEMGEAERRAEFMKFLKGFVVEKKQTTHLTPDMSFAPESEITVETTLRTGK